MQEITQQNRIFLILISVIDVCMKFTNCNNITYILKTYKNENIAAYLSCIYAFPTVVISVVSHPSWLAIIMK